MTTKLTLTWVKREQKTSKAGKPYTALSLKANEYADRYINGFGNKANVNWKEGDTVEVLNVTEKDYNGKKYLNFEMPSVEAATNEIKGELVGLSLGMGKLNFKLDQIIEHLAGTKRLDRTSDGKPMPNFNKPTTQKQAEDVGASDDIDPNLIDF